MRCVLRFSLFIVDGKLAISAPHGRADPVWAGTRGLRNSCSLATILLSPRFLNGSPPPPCPLLFLCIRLVFSPGCFVSAPHPSIMPVSLLLLPLPSVYHSLCFCLHPLLSSLSESRSLSLPSVPLFQRLQCPFAGDLEVQGLRRRGWGVPSHPITLHPAETLGLGGEGVPQKQKQKKTKQKNKNKKNP